MSRVAVENASGVRRDAVTAAKLQIFPVKHKQESPHPEDRRADRCAPDRNMLGVREQMPSFDSMTLIPFPEMFSPNQFPAALSDARIQLGRTGEKMGLTGLEPVTLRLSSA